MNARPLSRTGRRTAQSTVRVSARGEPPLVLERYRLHRRLGTGGFGTVWLARDERLERDVAVKVLPRERVNSGRFEREARAAARLAHPGIVMLYEAAVDDDGAYLVSELVRGATLDGLLEAGRLSDRNIISIGVALCEALAHAHGEGVIHRDVKPSNVLVPQRPPSPAQVAKLTDFGVARVIGGDSLTRTGDVVGTLAYMAPEQAEGREAGAAADLYSLALVLYEALTGINPVRANTNAQRARRLGAHLPPLRRQRRELPRELGRAVDLALRPRPRERGTVDELRAALILAAADVSDTPGVIADPWPARPSRDTQGEAFAEPESIPDGDPPRPVAVTGRGLGALAAAVLAAWLISHLLAPSPIAPLAGALLAAVLVVALPRAGWFALAACGCAVLALQGRPGGALLLALAALVPVVLLPRSPSMWPLAAGAPALGLVGLAGAWPVLAARAGTAWRRAGLGIAGWVWLTIASPLADADLYIARARGTPPSSSWLPSLYDATHHVLGPMLSTGALAAAPVWGAAAAILPWLTRGRSFVVDLVLVSAWSLLAVSTSAIVMRLAATGREVPSLHGALLGAVAGAVLALGPATVNAWRSSHGSADPTPGLA